MTTPTIVPCRCSHPRRLHEREGFWPQCTAVRCECVRYSPAVPVAVSGRNQNLVSSRDRVSGNTELSFENTKRCTGCGETKPRSEFYARGDDTSKVSPKCRDCVNTRPRTRTVTRIVRVRARHRAVAELCRRYSVEFRDLLDYYTKTALAEAQQLAAAPAASSTYGKGQTVRLRPGQRRRGQSTADRIDVARCPECVGYHDRGHVCANCGQAPSHEATA